MVENKRKQIVTCGILVAVALLSFTLLASIFTNPETYKGIIGYLDSKKEIVTGLAGSSAAASAAITLLPGDVGVSIANSLASLSTKFLTVLIALYLEKYLLTIIAYAVFKIIIPFSCFLLILYVYKGKHWMLDIGVKFTILGVIMMLMIPCGVKTSQMVEDVYGASIRETIENATGDANDVIKNNNTTSDQGKSEINEKKDTTINGSFFDALSNIYNSIQGIASNVKDSASNVISGIGEYVENIPEKVTTLLNKFIEATAVMIITSCVIPLLVVWLFLFIIKLLFGINFDYSNALDKLERKQQTLMKKLNNQ